MVPQLDRLALGLSFGICAACLIAGSVPAVADQLTLENGDRLSGKVLRIDGDNLVFKPVSFDEVKVPLAVIESVTTDNPVTVEFKEGGYATGRLSPSDGGEVRLTGPNETTSRFDLATLEAIHPDGRIPVPQFKWSGHLNLGVSNSSGNTNNEAYNLDVETIARGEKDRITLGALFNREKSDGDETVDNAKASAQYDRFVSKVWYLYLSGSAERDDFEDLKLRTTIGAGAGYQIIDTQRTQLSLESGPTYVNEDFDMAPDEEFPGGRWATKYSMWVFDEFAQLFHNHEGIVNLENTDDILLQTRTGIRIPVRNSLNVTAQVNWDYDSEPAPGNKKKDTKYILSVGYLW